MDDDPGSSSLWAVIKIFGSAALNEQDWALTGLKLIIVVICGILSRLYSGSEVAILSVNRIRLLELREQGRKTAGILLEILEKPNLIISTLLVANTTVNVIMVVVWTNILLTINSTYQLDHNFVWDSVTAGSLVITGGGILLTAVLVMFCEIHPKRLFYKNPEFYALNLAVFLKRAIIIFRPIVYITFNVSRSLLKLFGVRISTESSHITEEEIIDLIETGEEEGLIQEHEKEMIHSIFEFGDLKVKDIMVPRVDMHALNKDANVTEALRLIVERGHSRIPVYRRDRDDIIGIVYAKDLLGMLADEAFTKMRVEQIMREVEFVPEEMPLSNLFNEMKRKKTHFAIVADEYGGTAGLVTIEDVLEEIVGEIEDEFDVAKPLYHENKGVWIVNGKLNLHDLEDLLDMEFPENGADTVGGLIYMILGRIPDVGDLIEYNGATFKVLSVQNQRITEIEVRKPLVTRISEEVNE